MSGKKFTEVEFGKAIQKYDEQVLSEKEYNGLQERAYKHAEAVIKSSPEFAKHRETYGEELDLILMETPEGMKVRDEKFDSEIKRLHKRYLKGDLKISYDEDHIRQHGL
jgi:hypothetical protein